MNLNPIKANMTELDFGCKRILFSYRTPVALFDRDTNEYYRTQTRWSNTTQRHISQWTKHLSEPVEWHMKPQEFFDNFIAGVR